MHWWNWAVVIYDTYLVHRADDEPRTHEHLTVVRTYHSKRSAIHAAPIWSDRLVEAGRLGDAGNVQVWSRERVKEHQAAHQRTVTVVV